MIDVDLPPHSVVTDLASIFAQAAVRLHRRAALPLPSGSMAAGTPPSCQNFSTSAQNPLDISTGKSVHGPYWLTSVRGQKKE